jgi:PBSX family phage terminase large subunit
MKQIEKIIKSHPCITEIMNNIDKYFIICLYGGRDSGKSYLMAQIIVMLCCLSRVKMAVFRAENKQLDDSIKDKIVDVIKEWGLDIYCYSKLKKNRSIIVNNKITITIGGHTSVIRFDAVENNPEKLRGGFDEYDYMVFEEWSQFSGRVMEIALPTIERARSGMPHILGTCNLETPHTWIYDQVKLGGFDEKNQQWSEMMDLKRERKEPVIYDQYAWAIEMLYDTNPWLPEFAKDNIELLRKTNYEEYLIIYRNQPRLFTEDIIFKNNVRIADEPFFLAWDMAGNATLNDIRHTVYYGMDFGFNHLFSNVECVVDATPHFSRHFNKNFSGKIYITRCIAERELQPDMIAERVEDWMPEQLKYHLKTYGDCARPDTIKSLSKGGSKGLQPKFNILPCYKWQKSSNSKGGNTMRALPTSRGCVLDRIAFLQSYEIIINPSCQKDIKSGKLHCNDVWHDFTHYRFKKDSKTEQILDEVVKLNDDVPDSLAYALQLLIQTAYGINLVGDDYVQRDHNIQNASFLTDNFITAI